MAERLSRGPLSVTGLTIVELNDVLRRIQTELDRLAGLQGAVTIYDSLNLQDDDGQVIHGWGTRP